MYSAQESEDAVTKLEEAERLLTQLTPAEKAQLLQWVVQELSNAFPGIEHTPGVVGGSARIVRTRVPVWVLVQARRQGLTEAQILQSYPSLRAEDLANAWAYAQSHKDEIDQQITLNEAA